MAKPQKPAKPRPETALRAAFQTIESQPVPEPLAGQIESLSSPRPSRRRQ